MHKLSSLGHPQYPAREWHEALARAIAADEQSRITARREEALSCYDAGVRHPRRRAIEELESRLVGAKCSAWLQKRGLACDFH